MIHPAIVDTSDLGPIEYGVAGIPPNGKGNTQLVYQLPGVRTALVTTVACVAEALHASSMLVTSYTTE